MSLVSLVVGLAALLAGRQLFWLFVAAAGFFLGFNVTQTYLQPEAAWMATVIGVITGALGALLAVFAQRLAIGIAGFITGGYLFGLLAGYLGLAGAAGSTTTLNPIIFVAGGVIGAVLLSVFFDAALIVLSALLGATLIMESVAGYTALDPALRSLIYILLILVGSGLQWMMWSDRSGRRDRR